VLSSYGPTHLGDGEMEKTGYKFRKVSDIYPSGQGFQVVPGMGQWFLVHPYVTENDGDIPIEKLLEFLESTKP
jgi:hypothetical protein